MLQLARKRGFFDREALESHIKIWGGRRIVSDRLFWSTVMFMCVSAAEHDDENVMIHRLHVKTDVEIRGDFLREELSG